MSKIAFLKSDIACTIPFLKLESVKSQRVQRPIIMYDQLDFQM